jgi:O-antigen ligase
VSERGATAAAEPSAPRAEPRETSFFVVVRVVAVAALALLVPLAGAIALGGLVLLWLFRSRVEIGTMLALYALLLFLVPSRYSIGGFAITAAMLVAFVTLLLWVYGRALGTSGLQPHRNGARFAVVALFATTLAAYGLRMLDPVGSVDQRNADRNIAITLALCTVALALIEGIRSRRQLNTVLGALVVGAAFVAGLGYLQYFADLDIAQYIRPPGFSAEGHEAFIYTRDGLPRVAGTARHPIEFGIAMAAVLPIAMHFAAYARTLPARWGAVVASAAIAGVIPLALSRSAVLSFALAALIVLPTWTAKRRLRVIGMLALAALALNLAAPQIFPKIGGLLSQSEGTESLETRGRAADVAFELVNEAPILGHGFSAAFESPVVIDNQYLITTIETGVIGLLALLVVIGGGILTARRARMLSDDPATRDLAQALIATIAAVALGGFGLNVVRFPMTAGILFLGVGAAGALIRFERQVDRRRASDVQAGDAGVTGDEPAAAEPPYVLVGGAT